MPGAALLSLSHQHPLKRRPILGALLRQLHQIFRKSIEPFIHAQPLRLERDPAHHARSLGLQHAMCMTNLIAKLPSVMLTDLTGFSRENRCDSRSTTVRAGSAPPNLVASTSRNVLASPASARSDDASTSKPNPSP